MVRYTAVMDTSNDLAEKRVFDLEGPAPKLMTYYFLTSLLAGPFFFFPLIPLYFRYHTLRYRFDSEGISMRWGIFFRREINLTYARIQDIHLRSNLFERWLGLARIEVQTASGSAGAEMTLEGLLEYEVIRDYLYSRMRGGEDRRKTVAAGTAPGVGRASDSAGTRQLVDTLNAVTAEVKALRETFEAARGQRHE